MKDNKVLNFLKMKSTRVVAFITACAVFAVCSGIFLYKYFSLNNIYRRYNNDYLSSAEYHSEEEKLFTDLWLVGNMYLSHLDEDGKFVGTKELRRATEDTLRSLNLMDKKGNITIRNYKDCDWYVAWNGENEIFNNGNFDEIYSDDYSFTQQYGNMYNRHYYNYNYYGYGLGEYYTYTTNYGMTYYYYNVMGRQKAIALFDFDTTGLDWYIDNNGAKIYYKDDGSMPIPYESEDDGYYNYGEEVYEVPQPVEEMPDKIRKDSESLYLYNAMDETWLKIDNDKFSRQYSDEYPLTICITPKESLIANYKEVKHDVDTASDSLTAILLDLVPFIALVAVLMCYVLIAGGYNTKERKFTTGRVEKIYAEVIVCGIIAFAILGMAMFAVIDEIYNRIENINNSITNATLFITAVLTGSLAFLVYLTNSIIKRLKCRIFWNTTITKKIFVKIWRKIKSIRTKIKEHRISTDDAKNNRFTRQFLIKLGIFTLLEIIAIIGESPFMLCVFTIAYAFANLRDISDITNLSAHISRMNSGDYTKENVSENSVAYTMNEKLNNISDGLQTAVEKRLQSERMKIDLVTNVSHDLKTPLTSIISYINLLSQEELPDVARDYVKILENKSERLREIVADVFDVAKATSRTDIQLEMIDAVVLMEQVFADMSDKIEKSDREIRKTISATSAPIYADGKKLYRVLQNIIDNALKYSLENTRVYLSLERDDENVIISVKNISSYEIKFTPEEIVERFTRGDESRTSDGNGLGLSIAKSFTEACNGKFEIIINGDLFEADVILPITEKLTVSDK